MDLGAEGIKVNVPFTTEVVLNHGDFLEQNLLACIGSGGVVFAISFGEFLFPDVSFTEDTSLPSIVSGIVQAITIGIMGSVGGRAATLVLLVVDNITSDGLHEILMDVVAGIGANKARLEVGLTCPRARPSAPLIISYREYLKFLRNDLDLYQKLRGLVIDKA